MPTDTIDDGGLRTPKLFWRYGKWIFELKQRVVHADALCLCHGDQCAMDKPTNEKGTPEHKRDRLICQQSDTPYWLAYR